MWWTCVKSRGRWTAIWLRCGEDLVCAVLHFCVFYSYWASSFQNVLIWRHFWSSSLSTNLSSVIICHFGVNYSFNIVITEIKMIEIILLHLSMRLWCKGAVMHHSRMDLCHIICIPSFLLVGSFLRACDWWQRAYYWSTAALGSAKGGGAILPAPWTSTWPRYRWEREKSIGQWSLCFQKSPKSFRKCVWVILQNKCHFCSSYEYVQKNNIYYMSMYIFQLYAFCLSSWRCIFGLSPPKYFFAMLVNMFFFF